MITVVNGLVVIVDIDDRTMVMVAWGSKSRHVQDAVMSEVRQQEKCSVRLSIRGTQAEYSVGSENEYFPTS